ncbi:MAG: glycosyltransferase family 4 protein [Thermoanaerobaculia bacterium]
MNILFLSDTFPPERNASATRVYERACYWVRWGHRVTVITGAPNFPDGKIFSGYKNRYGVETVDGIRVVRVPTYLTANAGFTRRTLDFLSYMVAAVGAGLAEDEPDLVAATSPQFFAAVGGWVLARLRGVPFVFELGDLWPASIEAVGASRNALLLRALERVELFLYRESAAVIALTRRFKEDLVRREIAPGHVAVVRNGVDLPRYGPRGRDPVLDAELGTRDRFVVGYLGTHGMAHDLGNALDAAALLSDDPRALFLFVGAGAERERLVADAAARRLANARFVPAQPKELMPRLWSLCDVALIHLKANPVFATVIPSKIFEAMGMGLPILLVAPDGEAREIVEGAGAGEWVPAGRPTLLAEAVRRLVKNGALRRRLAAASLAAAPMYSREEQAREVLRVFTSVLAGREPA